MNSKRVVEAVISEFGYIPFGDIRLVFADKYSKLRKGLLLCDLLNTMSQGVALNQ